MGDHHGFLIKEGAVVKSWKKRYFVLKNEELTYSKKDNADNLGAIDMEDVKHVHPVEYKKKKFCFAVETPKRTYYLVADDEKYPPSLPHRTLIPAQNSRHVGPRPPDRGGSHPEEQARAGSPAEPPPRRPGRRGCARRCRGTRSLGHCARQGRR